MKETKLDLKKIVKIFCAILLVSVGLCDNAYAVNEDTPGLSFENGASDIVGTENTEGKWIRYYGYWGPVDFGANQFTHNVSNLYYGQKRYVRQSSDESGWVPYDKRLYVKFEQDGTPNENIRTSPATKRQKRRS